MEFISTQPKVARKRKIHTLANGKTIVNTELASRFIPESESTTVTGAMESAMMRES